MQLLTSLNKTVYHSFLWICPFKAAPLLPNRLGGFWENYAKRKSEKENVKSCSKSSLWLHAHNLIFFWDVRTFFHWLRYCWKNCSTTYSYRPPNIAKDTLTKNIYVFGAQNKWRGYGSKIRFHLDPVDDPELVFTDKKYFVKSYR
jgi:hypothetical protein